MASSDEETFYTPQRSEESAYSDSPSSPISRRWCRKLVGDGEGAARGGARAVELGLGGRRPALVDEAAQAAGGDERRSRKARGQLRHHRRVAPPQPLILLHQRRRSSYGILPEGVRGYTLGEDGAFEVYLSGECEFKVEGGGGGYLLRYKERIAGRVASGSLRELSGVSVRVLLVWFGIGEVVRSDADLDFYVGPSPPPSPSPTSRRAPDAAAASTAPHPPPPPPPPPPPRRRRWRRRRSRRRRRGRGRSR
uniref:Uncharacterized protein n=1 Tax=Ananas comosus var. bracteatus TaxID=296719 RepID=A0A6V7NHY4_ANACO|nr:unnamed protein product [Ananas comosus var. bracteatus]